MNTKDSPRSRSWVVVQTSRKKIKKSSIEVYWANADSALLHKNY